MKTAVFFGCRLVVWLLMQISSVTSEYTVSVQLVRFHNPTNKDASGRKCDGVFGLVNPCDIFLRKVCAQVVTINNGVWSVEKPCGVLSVEESSPVQDSEILHTFLGGDIGGVPNPVVVTGLRRDQILQLSMEVWDADAPPFDPHQFVDSFNITADLIHYTGSGSRERITKGTRQNADPTEIVVKETVQCSDGFYGDNCDISCQSGPADHYICNPSGQRICDSGWQYPDCTVPFGVVRTSTTRPTTPSTTVIVPSTIPSTIPSTMPSTTPSTMPSTIPSTMPSTTPSTIPPTIPSTSPSTSPSTIPPTVPSTTPSTIPSTIPPTVPSTRPSTAATTAPSSGGPGPSTSPHVFQASVTLISFSNPSNRDVTGRKCEGHFGVTNYCDIFLRNFCVEVVTEINGGFVAETPCNLFKQKKSRTIPDSGSTLVPFGEDIGGMSNYFVANGISRDQAIRVTFEVWDEDAPPFEPHTQVDTFSFTSGPQTLTVHNMKSALFRTEGMRPVQYKTELFHNSSVQCIPNHFTSHVNSGKECEVFCKAEAGDHFTCSSTGSKLCLPGWMYPDCTQRIPTPPSTQPTVPSTKSTFPSTVPSTKSTSSSTVPSTPPTSPPKQSTVPSTRQTVPSTRPTVPSTRPTMPSTRSSSPTTTQPTKTQPATKTTKPNNTSGQPSTKLPAIKPTTEETATQPSTKPLATPKKILPSATGTTPSSATTTSGASVRTTLNFGIMSLFLVVFQRGV